MFNASLAVSAPHQPIDPRIPRMDPDELALMQATPDVYVWNLGPKEHRAELGTLGRFTVPACEKGELVSEPLRIKGWVPETLVDSVDGRVVTFKWGKTSGRKIAADIVGVGPGKTKYQTLTQYGVFISAGDEPTALELDAARAAMNEHFSALVAEANNKYRVNGGMEIGDDGKPHNGITKDHVEAAEWLGLSPEWAKSPGAMVACEGCGQSVSPAAARCPHSGCGAILNEEKARKLFPHLFMAPVVESRGPGRPRREEVVA